MADLNVKQLEFNGQVYFDITADDAVAANVLAGKKFHTSTGSATGTMATGSVATPIATKSDPSSSYSVTVTPSVSVTAGYVATGGSKTGTAVTVTPTDLGLITAALTKEDGTVSISKGMYADKDSSVTVTKEDLGIATLTSADFTVDTTSQAGHSKVKTTKEGFVTNGFICRDFTTSAPHPQADAPSESTPESFDPYGDDQYIVIPAGLISAEKSYKIETLPEINFSADTATRTVDGYVEVYVNKDVRISSGKVLFKYKP